MHRILLGVAAAVLLAACSTASKNNSGTPPPQPSGNTIAISMTDQLRFQPAAVSVKAGQTVTFSVTNTGKLAHEFAIGDQAFHKQHEEEMKKMGMGMMADEPNAISVPAGKTKTLTHTFPAAGTLVYGCHVSGHYLAGMKGTITVT